MEPAVPRDAATVIVARDAPGGIEIYMLRRSQKSKAFPDLWVFPGGTIDPDDHGSQARERLTGRLAVDEPAVIYGAIRETFEECGLLFADRPVPPARLHAARRELLAGTRSFGQTLIDLDIRLDAGALRYFARRVTPPKYPHRFDARFFLAGLPEGQVAEADAFETHDGRWIEPGAMLALAETTEINLPRPTAGYLEDLRAFRTVDALLASRT